MAKGVTPETWTGSDPFDYRVSSVKKPRSARIRQATGLAHRGLRKRRIGWVRNRISFQRHPHRYAGTQTYERGPGGKYSHTKSVVNCSGCRMDVQLTIDRDVQFSVEEAIRGLARRSGASSATAVVMDVRTGEIVAMATAPTLTPTEFHNRRRTSVGIEPSLTSSNRDRLERSSPLRLLSMKES